MGQWSLYIQPLWNNKQNLTPTTLSCRISVLLVTVVSVCPYIPFSYTLIGPKFDPPIPLSPSFKKYYIPRKKNKPVKSECLLVRFIVLSTTSCHTPVQQPVQLVKKKSYYWLTAQKNLAYPRDKRIAFSCSVSWIFKILKPGDIYIIELLCVYVKKVHLLSFRKLHYSSEWY